MIRVIGDTTCGMTLAQAQELGIEYLPQIIVFGEESYRDDTEIDAETFVKKLEASKELPKTSAPMPALYEPIYRDMMEKGDTGIVIVPSAELSGTIRGATGALAEFPGLDVRIVDTKSVACGMAVMLRRAKEWADAGRSLDEIEAMVREMAEDCRLYAVVDTLEYLHKGGRIGGAAKLFGDVLQVKPVITVKGRVEVYEKVRTKKKAIVRLLDIVSEQCKDYAKGDFCLALTPNHPDREMMVNEFKARFGVEDIPVVNVPPAIMVHAGPGVVVCTFFTK